MQDFSFLSRTKFCVGKKKNWSNLEIWEREKLRRDKRVILIQSVQWVEFYEIGKLDQFSPFFAMNWVKFSEIWTLAILLKFGGFQAPKWVEFSEIECFDQVLRFKLLIESNFRKVWDFGNSSQIWWFPGTKMSRIFWNWIVWILAILLKFGGFRAPKWVEFSEIE